MNSIKVLCFALLAMFGFVAVFMVFYPLKYRSTVEQNANKYNLDVALVLAIINAESRFKNNRVSSAGAIGLMQIMPTTANFIAQELGYENFSVDDLFTPSINIEFGCYYLNYLLKKFENVKTVVASYNAGETIVRGWLNDQNYSSDGKTLQEIPFLETQNYCKKVSDCFRVYSYILNL